MPAARPTWLDRWRDRARQLRFDTFALYLAYRDPRVPWYAKVFAALVVGYAFSPVDLVPDFIPVLGYLDDLLLIPLGISLALRMVPPEVMEEKRLLAREQLGQNHPVNRIAAAVVVLIWLAGLVWLAFFIYKQFLDN